MLVVLLVTVVGLNYGVEKGSEISVTLVATSVATNSRVNVLAARQNALLESHTRLIGFVLKLFPNFGSEVLAQERLGASREDREILNVLRGLQMVTALSALRSLGSLGGRAELFLSIDHSLDTVVHVLNELDLGETKTALVADVVNVVVGLGVLTVSTTDLNVVPVGNLLEETFLEAE
jgi:hypothetical protein